MKTSKSKLFAASLLVIIISSCVSHFFSEPVPTDVKNYNSLPKPMFGVWQNEGETHIIDKEKWIKQTQDSMGNTISEVEYKLSDSLAIRKVGKNHFINVLEENGYWSLYLGFKQKDYFYIRGLGAADTLIFMNALGLTPSKSESQDDYFYNSPITKKQMETFIKNGGFADTVIVFDIKNRTVKD
jgi:hypothetical protein